MRPTCQLPSPSSQQSSSSLKSGSLSGTIVVVAICLFVCSVVSSLWAASAKASCALNVLLPTPPLPLRTITVCLMLCIRLPISSISGSATAPRRARQNSLLGQPWHALASPAFSACVPGQCGAATMEMKFKKIVIC